MSTEKLYEAITLIDDDLIDEAGTYAPKKKKAVHWKRWTALAACLVLVVGAGGIFLSQIGGRNASSGNSAGGSGADGGSTFLSYAGPVFPLTTMDDASGITVQRDITFDFAPWSSVQYSTDIIVTDAYTLTNSTGEDKTLSVLYPFVSNLREVDERLPALTAGGEELNTPLYMGPYSGGFEGVMGPDGPSEEQLNLDQLNSWEEYKALLKSGDYAEKTLADFPDLSGVSVIVYELSDAWGDSGNKNAPNPFLRVTFGLDYAKTTVLSYGFNGGLYDREKGVMGKGFSIPEPGEPDYGESYFLIVLGDDIENMKIEGYVTGGWDTKTKLDDFGVTVDRYETDLDTILRRVTARQWENMQKWDGGITAASYETYHGLFCDYLLSYGVLAGDGGVARYDGGSLEDLDVAEVGRVCYLETEITIPAGESVTLSARIIKPASFDYYCTHTENQGVCGYDMVPRLGSTLSFTGQTATLLDRGQIEIVRQNFGFNLESGIQTVELDPDIEHYYLEVKQLQAAENK